MTSRPGEGWTPLIPSFGDDEAARCAFAQCIETILTSPPDTWMRPEARAALFGNISSRSPLKPALRVAVSIVCDLRAHGWQMRVHDGVLEVSSPLTAESDPGLEKARVRGNHLIDRDFQLAQAPTRRFIQDMERSRLVKGQWRSIFSLMRDGRELVAQLEEVAQLPDGEAAAALRRVVDPYVQPVDSSECQFTGFRLADIWRYFRHTWTTKYNSTPGRKIWFLVRDRAAVNHPVVGIASLGSAVVQLSSRDRWIGWSAEQFLRTLDQQPSGDWAHWLWDSLEHLLAAIYVRDFLREGIFKRSALRHPSTELIAWLRKESVAARKAHVLHVKASKHKKATSDPEGADWAQQAETYLFRSKRAGVLADLLETQRSLKECGFTEPTRASLVAALSSKLGRRAVQTVLRNVRAAHVGVDMLDITVCGAVAPYNHLLGGKLVSLLMASPEVLVAYEQRYKSAISLIASSMAGEPIRRKPTLVLLGTTSLYGVSASQYNRLRMPLQGDGGLIGELRYELLGKSQGFGTYHFTQPTMDMMEALLRLHQDGRRVNSIFGEGVNPKLRKIRAALDEVGFPSDVLLRHGSPRLVYGVPLATNFREVLLGRTTRPKYLLPKKYPEAGTAVIVDFFSRRWLLPRARRPDVLDAVRAHTLAYPVTHGARVVLPEIDLPLFAPQPVAK